MSLLTPSEFQDMLMRTSPDDVVNSLVLGGTVHFFEEHPEARARLEAHLSENLPLSHWDYTIVGSAKVGFSLDPNGFPHPPVFSEASDIDVLIVDQAAFDRLWAMLREWGYWGRRQGAGNRKMHEQVQYGIYSGWVEPDRIQRDALALPKRFRGLRDFCVAWFNCFKGLARCPEFSARDVSARLYRTRNFARLYHRNGLQLIRSKLEKQRREMRGPS